GEHVSRQGGHQDVTEDCVEIVGEDLMNTVDPVCDRDDFEVLLLQHPGQEGPKGVIIIKHKDFAWSSRLGRRRFSFGDSALHGNRAFFARYFSVNILGLTGHQMLLAGKRFRGKTASAVPKMPKLPGEGRRYARRIASRKRIDDGSRGKAIAMQANLEGNTRLNQPTRSI